MSSESRPKPRPDRSARSAALARISDRPKGKRSLCGSSQGQLPRPRSKVWSGAWPAPGRPSAERPSSGRTFPGRFPPEDGPSARAILRRHGRDAARPSREPPGRPRRYVAQRRLGLCPRTEERSVPGNQRGGRRAPSRPRNSTKKNKIRSMGRSTPNEHHLTQRLATPSLGV